MMISRRGFFTRTLTHGTATAIATFPVVTEARGEIPDSFEVRGGWKLQWAGWRPSVDRDVVVGWWIGYREGQDLRYCMTTTGMFQPYRPGNAINLRQCETWPWLTSTSSAEEKTVVRERSCRELVRRLHAGELED